MFFFKKARIGTSGKDFFGIFGDGFSLPAAAVIGGGVVTDDLFLGSDARKLQMAVTSPDGSPAPAALITLVSENSSGVGFRVTISDQQEFASLSDGKYELALLSSEFSLGKDKLRIRALLNSGTRFLGYDGHGDWSYFGVQCQHGFIG